MAEKNSLWKNIRNKAKKNRESGATPKKPTDEMLRQERKIKAKQYAEGGPVNTLEGDLISKVIMNRNKDKDFVKRAYAVGEYPESNMFVQPDANEFGVKNSHLMGWGEDESGQAYMYPEVMNPNNEAVKVPNQYADYISSTGYKKATGIQYAEGSFVGKDEKLPTYNYANKEGVVGGPRQRRTGTELPVGPDGLPIVNMPEFEVISTGPNTKPNPYSPTSLKEATQTDAWKAAKLGADAASLYGFYPANVAGSAMDLMEGDYSGAVMGLVPVVGRAGKHGKFWRDAYTKGVNAGLPNKVIFPLKKYGKQATILGSNIAQAADSYDDLVKPYIGEVKDAVSSFNKEQKAAGGYYPTQGSPKALFKGYANGGYHINNNNQSWRNYLQYAVGGPYKEKEDVFTSPLNEGQTMFQPETKWYQDWINNPEYATRMEKNFKAAGAGDFMEGMGLGDVAKNYNINENRKGIQALINTTSNKLGNIKTLYNKNPTINESLITEYKNKYGRDPESLKIINKNLGNANQGWTDSEGRIVITPTANEMYGPSSVKVHEDTHATGLDTMFKGKFKPTSSQDPEVQKNFRRVEQYPFLMQMRYDQGFKPGEEITPERLKQIRESGYQNHLFKNYTDDEISNYLNTLASNTEQQTTQQYAAEGGYTNPYNQYQDDPYLNYDTGGTFGGSAAWGSFNPNNPPEAPAVQNYAMDPGQIAGQPNVTPEITPNAGGASSGGISGGEVGMVMQAEKVQRGINTGMQQFFQNQAGKKIGDERAAIAMQGSAKMSKIPILGIGAPLVDMGNLITGKTKSRLKDYDRQKEQEQIAASQPIINESLKYSQGGNITNNSLNLRNTMRNKRFAKGGTFDQFGINFIPESAGLHHESANGGVPIGPNAKAEGGEAKLQMADGGQYIVSGEVDGANTQSINGETMTQRLKKKLKPFMMGGLASNPKDKENVRRPFDSYSEPAITQAANAAIQETEAVRMQRGGALQYAANGGKLTKDIEKIVMEEYTAAYGGTLPNKYKGKVNMPNSYAKGGIHIKESKKGTFTAAATKHGKSVQEFAQQVLANKENYSPGMVKKANFARNAAKWNHADGGYVHNQMTQPMLAEGGPIYGDPASEYVYAYGGMYGNPYARGGQIDYTNDMYSSYAGGGPMVSNVNQPFKGPAAQNRGGMYMTYADGGMMPSEEQIMQQQMMQQQQAPQEQMQQQGGQDQMMQMVQQVIEALMQGANPEQVMQQLVQSGMPQEQAQQVVQMAIQDIQSQQQQQPMQQSEQSMQGQEQQMPPQQGMATGGKLPKDILRARAEAHMSPEEAANYVDNYAIGGKMYYRGGPDGPPYDLPGMADMTTSEYNSINSYLTNLNTPNFVDNQGNTSSIFNRMSNRPNNTPLRLTGFKTPTQRNQGPWQPGKSGTTLRPDYRDALGYDPNAITPNEYSGELDAIEAPFDPIKTPRYNLGSPETALFNQMRKTREEAAGTPTRTESYNGPIVQPTAPRVDAGNIYEPTEFLQPRKVGPLTANANNKIIQGTDNSLPGLVPMDTSFPEDVVKKPGGSEGMSVADWGTMIGQLAGPASQFFQRKPKPFQYKKAQATTLDPTAAIVLANQASREAQATADYNIKQNAPTSGSYLANIRANALQSGLGRGRTGAGIRQQYDIQNAGILNQMGQYNTEIENRNIDAMQQDLANWQEQRTNALYNAGANIAGMRKDYKDNQINEMIAKNIGTNNWQYDEATQTIKYKTPSGQIVSVPAATVLGTNAVNLGTGEMQPAGTPQFQSNFDKKLNTAFRNSAKKP